MPVLPLFPLGTVLMPGEHLPLQVFEPRYLRLLRDLSDRQPVERVFGVVGIRHGHEVGEGRHGDLFDVGCVARLEAADIVRDAGQAVVVRVVAIGTDRFRLERILDAGTPYETAEVTILGDRDDGTSGAECRGLAERLVASFSLYQRAVGSPESIVLGPVERVAAQVTQAMAVSIADRQQVLEADGDGQRLRAALGLVQRELGIVATFHAVPVSKGQVNPN